MTFGTIAKLVFQQAQAAGYGGEDTCAAIRVLEDLVHDEVRASADPP
jgi:hypothetical protein